MGRFLVHMDDSGEDIPLPDTPRYELQSHRKILFLFFGRQAVHKFWRCGNERFHHHHAVLAYSTARFGYHSVNLFLVGVAGRRHKVVIVFRASHVNVGVAFIGFFLPLVVAFTSRNAARFAFLETQDCVRHNSSSSFLRQVTALWVTAVTVMTAVLGYPCRLL
ncbi:hypothetical protein EB20_02547 [Enterococcus hirae]|nr:hypothetical protein EB20_02547 [Enterococcus hirae]RBT46953.1 hypothetical protein EB10_02764 [Enterococcus hirae]RBT51620.1 hypothetical protein EB24_02763 [Enterococcus hirae]RBT57867.1 hypothetical protein EB39_02764 [Enterococcus hirae]